MSQGAVTFLYTGDANSVQKSQQNVQYNVTSLVYRNCIDLY